MNINGAKILIADDEECLLRILNHNLTKWGATVVAARDGVEGFEQAQRELPDLILTDFQMPRLDGLGFCARLRECPATAETPIIMLTARGHRVTPEELQALKIGALLPKPFSIKAIRATIEEALKQLIST